MSLLFRFSVFIELTEIRGAVDDVLFIISIISKLVGRNSAVGIAGRSGDQLSVGARFSALVQTGPALIFPAH
jgi:hypothetical protein